MVLGHNTLGLFSQVSEVLLKPSRDLICNVKCWVCFRAASTAQRSCPNLWNLFGCSGSSTDQCKALFGHGTFVVVEQKAKMYCHLQVGSVTLCLYRGWFIYYIVICKGAHTSWEVMVQLCPCRPDFHSNVFFGFMPHQVKYTSEGWSDFYTSSPLGSWQRGRQKKSHMAVSSTPQTVL